jgi:hypothetical protein
MYGTKTDIHDNKRDGIYALRNGKVNIHLPSQHNTSHDNVGQNRVQGYGGSIANCRCNFLARNRPRQLLLALTSVH